VTVLKESCAFTENGFANDVALSSPSPLTLSHAPPLIVKSFRIYLVKSSRVAAPL